MENSLNQQNANLNFKNQTTNNNTILGKESLLRKEELNPNSSQRFSIPFNSFRNIKRHLQLKENQITLNDLPEEFKLNSFSTQHRLSSKSLSNTLNKPFDSSIKPAVKVKAPDVNGDHVLNGTISNFNPTISIDPINDIQASTSNPFKNSFSRHLVVNNNVENQVIYSTPATLTNIKDIFKQERNSNSSLRRFPHFKESFTSKSKNKKVRSNIINHYEPENNIVSKILGPVKPLPNAHVPKIKPRIKYVPLQNPKSTILEVQMILARKTKDDSFYYLAKLKGLPHKKNQWIPEKHLFCDQLIEAFEASLPGNHKRQYCYSIDEEGNEVLSLPENIARFMELMSADKGPLISIYNDLDSCGPPDGFVCINENIYGKGVSPPILQAKDACKCEDGCSINNFNQACHCHNHNFMNYGTLAYDKYGLLLIPERGCIVECNDLCKCPITCINRVVQRGRDIKLQIFKTLDRGWGVRALEPIPKGKFITEYTGEIITNIEAEERGTKYDLAQSTYLFDMDFHQQENDEDPIYTLDAYHYGNVSHFFNHSCDPNMIVNITYTTGYNSPIYRLSFFALRDIGILEELTFDYSPGGVEYNQEESEDMITKREVYKCLCGVSNCKKVFH